MQKIESESNLVFLNLLFLFFECFFVVVAYDQILSELNENRINIYRIPDCDSDEDDEFKEQNKQLKEAMPFAVVGSSQTIEVRGKKVRGRCYPWGVVEIENIEHNDFVKLRTMLM